MLLTALQRYAAAHTAETTTSTVDIPNDEMKGRIIGREGRNIRAFEKATGVDVIIDDTPGVVIVSGFDPVRREVARQVARQTHRRRADPPIADRGDRGRNVQKEMEQFIRRKRARRRSRRSTSTACTSGSIYLLGRLHFRTSYSQNVLRHSVEVAFLTGMLAEDDRSRWRIWRVAAACCTTSARRPITRWKEAIRRSAPICSNATARAPEVIHAALGHHDEILTEYPYTMLVATADACSASRPGAAANRSNATSSGMEELESIATGFPGVEQAFAIQAGRELRVIASAKDTDDAKAAKICRDIAKAFEERLTYPGEIKVTVVRESRFTEMAR